MAPVFAALALSALLTGASPPERVVCHRLPHGGYVPITVNEHALAMWFWSHPADYEYSALTPCGAPWPPVPVVEPTSE